MGLKESFRPTGEKQYPCSNRTIVGLKVTPRLTRLSSGKLQQSHHCGIESYEEEDKLAKQSESGSNRTIVGLKDAPFGRDRDEVVGQQSHHCGIESWLYDLGFRHNNDAAIAPLWD